MTYPDYFPCLLKRPVLVPPNSVHHAFLCVLRYDRHTSKRALDYFIPEASEARRPQKPGGPKGHRARITGGSFLRARTEGICPANFVRPTCLRCPPYSKDGWVSQSVCPSVCRSALNALKAGNVFLRDFAYVRIQTGAKQPQKKKKKKEATGYFSCHKVTSHTEEMNNIRKTDPGYQKSSVS